MPHGSPQKRNYQEIPSGTESAVGVSASTVLLATTSLITIGSHYNKHSLSSLGPVIIEALDLHRTKYGLLFSSQAIPGIVLPIISGIALSCLPYGPAAITLSSLIMFSTVLCAVGVMHLSYNMLIAGRFLFGLCDGALTTLQGAIIARYFRSRSGIGFGTMLLVSRLSSSTGLTLPAYIFDLYGLNIAMWFSVLLCIPPFLATVAYARLTTDSVVPPMAPSIHLLMSMLRRLTVPFWLVAYDWLVVASVVFTLLHFAPDAFKASFGWSPLHAGLLSGGMVLYAGVTSPLFGVLQDRTGRRGYILAGCCTLLLCGAVLCSLAIMPTLASATLLYAGLISVAIGFGAAPVTLMSSVALSVDDAVVPAALGVYKAVENAGMSVIHVGVGALRDSTGDYVLSFLLLAALAGTGILASCALSHSSRFVEHHCEVPPDVEAVE
ncbi:Major facilitator superfamily domain-containing protein 1 [Gracilariopsis chorda]|uniref:Lysosomal dipeptide transporter MFSD1 n=1 Tax=Gracilariopsis chorda TaxID=448386 RepID=A0A2V3J902_9FLOR|nr:Major facilitator superfamily domain-containing protein 1 [Gracilariopsis chorda]|eukprot:PXF50117.1 Major facilitator superfamily domain-containing protein 1 [Gracilariopsis chorda]